MRVLARLAGRNLPQRHGGTIRRANAPVSISPRGAMSAKLQVACASSSSFNEDQSRAQSSSMRNEDQRAAAAAAPCSAPCAQIPLVLLVAHVHRQTENVLFGLLCEIQLYTRLLTTISTTQPLETAVL